MPSLQDLPIEVLVKIFSYLDLKSLDNIEQVADIFKEILDCSVQIWKHKIRSYCHDRTQLRIGLNYTNYARIRTCAKSLRSFYQKLVKVQDNFMKGDCERTTLDCLGASLNDRKVVKNPEWSRNHNFRGVYDMTLDQGRICASVYDTIQIWSTQHHRLTHMFTNSILDQDKTQTTCFTLNKDLLLCGTDNGYLKVININTEEIVSKARINSNSLSDVKCSNETIITLDWFGNLVFWKINAKDQLQQINHENAESFTVPFILRQRDMERLMDANSNHLITTFKSHITVYRFGLRVKEGLVISFPVYSDVFCLHLNEDLVAFGCKGTPRHEGSTFIHPVAGIASLKFTPPRVHYLRTPDNDPVISIYLTKSHVILGDVNGEIHVISIQNIQFDQVEKFTDLGTEGSELLYTLKSHAYRDFIWALKFDGYRLFSGDETGKIIVHDVFNVDPKVVEKRTKEREAKKPRLELETALDEALAEANSIALALEDSNTKKDS